MHLKALATMNTLTLVVLAPFAIAQSSSSETTKTSVNTSGTSVGSVASATSSAAVVTMMWNNSPTDTTPNTAPATSGSTEAGMTMSDGSVMTGTDMSMSSTTTGTALAGMAGMNMSSAGRVDIPGVRNGMAGIGMIVVSLGAGVGLVFGML
ncbi:hypothetical protein P153DRAFT_368168 [Dothidotthia symphoricarpi CBS 119687]|uniref:Uncharacterized protein n=1 Tax=Dothidotthia symphoricarpi CBS 119687 TaxID=1392245 RepID=A0A6A6A6F4_9PLEO|nr:uncharacterized protein P153DRAFT_368168 [Dothidotthia symphoricarpi CBS 119687]KAF2127562.1 hypothetical protein P153DRAFT_368168 [Dothidotthia symphoricarpi CBS 119687]